MLYGSFRGLNQPGDNYEREANHLFPPEEGELNSPATEAYFQNIHCNNNKTVTTTF